MKNQKILVVFLAVLVILVVIVSAYRYQTTRYKDTSIFYQTPASEEKFIPTNTPPAPVPIDKNANQTGFVAGHVTIGPNCPVQRIDQPCNPTPAQYTSHEVLVYASDGKTIKTRTRRLDVKGNYKISLPVGYYFVQISPAGIREGEKKMVTIKANQTTTVDFDIDTGIR